MSLAVYPASAYAGAQFAMRSWTMPIAKNVKQHMEGSSWIRRMFELGMALKRERGEENVFDLSLGNPVVEPPREFFDELRRITGLLTPGMHRYMPNAGYLETRQAVAGAVAKETGIPYGPQQVMMCVGAGGGINVVVHALCDPGDEVVIFKPFFAEYLFYASNHGAIPVQVGCGPGFTPDLNDLESKLSSRTKIVLLNSPNNPSGAVYTGQFIVQLASLLERRGTELGTEIYLVSDEPYRKIIFDGLSYPFPQRAYRRTITVTSYSKDLALPGERIGYVAVHPDCPGVAEIMDAFVFCNRVLGFVNAPALMQHAIVNLQHVTVDIADYQRKRDYLYDVLTDAGYSVFKPQGAFYMFPESPVPDELRLVEVLQRHGVLVVPGRGFGMPGYFRISYCVEDRVLKAAAPGLKAAIQELATSA